jgi:uncharacterized protein (DUF983 family)
MIEFNDANRTLYILSGGICVHCGKGPLVKGLVAHCKECTVCFSRDKNSKCDCWQEWAIRHIFTS